jgi:hypothetical protein
VIIPRAALLALLLGGPALAVQLVSPVPRLDADAVEYYSHLRSLYFDGDVDFANEFAHFGILTRWDKSQPTVTGHRRTVFSVGPALLWMPFYAGGDLLARARQDVQDGYSPAHIRAVCLGSLVYGVLGLLLVHRVLEDRFAPPVPFWTTLLLGYATFLFWYMAYEPVMSHAPSFFLAALALRLWWGRGAGLAPGRAALLGLVVGIATVVRWQNALLLVLPLSTLVLERERPARAAASAAALLGAFALALVPQLLVFKAVYGTYLLGHPAQGRDFLHLTRPALLETFFSSRHGLLFWTPVLWAGFLGLVGLFARDWQTGGRLDKDRWTAVLLALPILVMSYTNTSSGDWWAGGSYSNRRFDSTLPFLALGIGATLAALRRLAARRPGAVLAAGGAALVLWNVLFMEQYRRGAIPRDDTVSFARVAFNGADVLAAAVGSPVAWPANWIFSLRHGLPPDRYDLMVGKYLFFMQNNLGGVIDVGADPGLDQALLGEGWGVRTPCAGAVDGVCRPVEGRARLFAALDAPETLDVTVRAGGPGRVRVLVNGAAVAERALAAGLEDVTARVPGARWRSGLNEVAIEADAGATAAVDRLVFRRLEDAP